MVHIYKYYPQGAPPRRRGDSLSVLVETGFPLTFHKDYNAGSFTVQIMKNSHVYDGKADCRFQYTAFLSVYLMSADAFVEMPCINILRIKFESSSMFFESFMERRFTKTALFASMKIIAIFIV
jgi:hypothetical protein